MKHATVYEVAWSVEAVLVRVCIACVLLLALTSCHTIERRVVQVCSGECCRPFEVVRPVLPRGVSIHEAHELAAWVTAYNRLLRHCAKLHAATWWSGPIPEPVRYYVEAL